MAHQIFPGHSQCDQRHHLKQINHTVSILLVGRKMERKKAIEGHGIKNLPASPIPSSWKEEITALLNESVYDNSSSANSFLAGSYISIIHEQLTDKDLMRFFFEFLRETLN